VEDCQIGLIANPFDAGPNTIQVVVLGEDALDPDGSIGSSGNRPTRTCESPLEMKGTLRRALARRKESVNTFYAKGPPEKAERIGARGVAVCRACLHVLLGI